MKPVSLECGGKSPNVILADAPSLRVAAEATAAGVFVNAGQMSNAGTRLVIERSVHDEFLEHLRDAAEPWRPRHPFSEDARMGGLVDETQLDRVLAYVEAGVSEGARLAAGGRSSTWAMVTPSTPGAPRLRRTSSHPRSKMSLR
jgi:4-guanidinobutyraldehyde dehydrogenase/NAD-dependent aldehyde dehydrogenase